MRSADPLTNSLGDELIHEVVGLLGGDLAGLEVVDDVLGFVYPAGFLCFVAQHSLTVGL